MQLAEIGPWQFGIPEGWSRKENDSSNSYFENPEGDKGLYVKAIELSGPMPSPRKLAEYVQEVHERGFTQGGGNAWEVVERRGEQDGEVFRSALDLRDVAANYRVLSLVVSDCCRVIQITVHDYWCDNYAATRQQFFKREESIVRVPSA